MCAREHGGSWRCLREEWSDDGCRIDGGRVVCSEVECWAGACGAPADRVIDGTDGAIAAVGRRDVGCAIVDDEVRCWGSVPGRDFWEEAPAIAVRILGTEGAVDVSLDDDYYPGHGCVAHAQGHVSCWGRDEWGQLGLGVERILVEPRRVLGLERVASITAGAYHVCALDESARAWCWGDNGGYRISGLVRDGDVTRPHTPWLAPVGHLAAGVAGTCLVSDGALHCTGKNAWGLPGAGGDADFWSLWPTPWHEIALPERAVASSSAPYAHGDVGFPSHDACAILESGRVLCTVRVGSVEAPESLFLSEAPTLAGSDRLVLDGSGRVCGRTGGGWRCERGVQAVELDVEITDVDAHRRSLCGVMRSEVRCGDDTSDPRWAWPAIVGTEAAARVRLSDGLGCAIGDDGAVSCWGASSAGLLRAAEPVEREEAVTIPGLPRVSDVALGLHFACALASDGTVWCWGHRNALADGTPVRFAAARPIVR